MTRVKALSAVALLIGCAVAIPLSGQQGRGDPMAGSWMLNVEKSTFSPGPGPRLSLYRYENRPDGWTLWTAAGQSADGSPMFDFALRRYDGKEYPRYNVATITALATNEGTRYETQVSRILDARSTEVINKLNGRTLSTAIRTMASDGRSFTLKVTGTNADGQAVNDVWIFERISDR